MLKEQLYKACEDYLQKRFDAIEDRIKDLDESMAAETKSSVGDKYETGRAMLHLEKEKQMQQLAVLIESKKILNTINAQSKLDFVQQGAFVKTNQGAFYISISAGKLIAQGMEFFAITGASPIGQLLLGKKVGAKFDFRGKEYRVDEVF